MELHKEELESSSELEQAASEEREVVRRRLRRELGRNPTEAEIDEWLRQHTEGF